MPLPSFITKVQFMALVTSGVIYPKNVFLQNVEPLPKNALRAYFLVDFPIAKSNVMLTLTVSPEEHTQESAIRLLNEKLKQCSAIEYEDTVPLVTAAEESLRRRPQPQLVTSPN